LTLLDTRKPESGLQQLGVKDIWHSETGLLARNGGVQGIDDDIVG
jgi:hypothetical protein